MVDLDGDIGKLWPPSHPVQPSLNIKDGASLLVLETIMISHVLIERKLNMLGGYQIKMRSYQCQVGL